jgi:hypothetical protein
MVRRLGPVIAVCALLALPSITLAQENYVASEFIEEDIQNGMSSADIGALLDQTVGSATRPVVPAPRPAGRDQTLSYSAEMSLFV